MKQDFYRGQIHSNHKFGLPGPRTSRQAFGHDISWETHRDHAVFWAVVLCVAVGFLVAA
jgi:hypothetical protein